ncbi:N-succinylarginine dihydrolase [invertebrate metagenome]|uniref:N-succinylarginine dihydrolase n=1 Tax=invertebrate metagenome TaxID=1711999 RepID=A0A2H9T740_9ZZZZ
MITTEVNFDGLPGPTHHYGGLSSDNPASSNHQALPSNPKKAALQSLEKMKVLCRLGLTQGILPPHPRPYIPSLRQLGFTGNDYQILAKVIKWQPELLSAYSSSSAMWAANIATVSPSSDTLDNKVHITPANLIHQFHRSLELPFSAHLLHQIFSDKKYFIHHAPLPAHPLWSDEGSANHCRFIIPKKKQGIHLFVHNAQPLPMIYPRQTQSASRAIARLQGLLPESIVFAEQHPEAVAMGTFHNDVIATNNQNLLLCHEKAFAEQTIVYRQLNAACDSEKLQIIEVSNKQLPLKQAIKTYLFNSQLISLPDCPDKMALIVSEQCRTNSQAWNCLNELTLADNPITSIHSVDLDESMKNGGGPACLRLRMPLTQKELDAVHPGYLLSSNVFGPLEKWIHQYYRDRLLPEDLADPNLLNESRTALDELTALLNIGAIYDFQH